MPLLNDTKYYRASKFSHACYLNSFRGPEEVKAIVSNSMRKINRLIKDGLEFDHIVCCGVSGLAIAPIIAYKLKKHLIVVRKADDSSTHSGYKVEGLPQNSFTYIILDDFVSEGKSVQYMIDTINKQLIEGVFGQSYGDVIAEFVGIFSYTPSDSHPEYFYDNGGLQRSIRKNRFF